MKRIDIFDDEEFQSLDLDTKRAVLDTYFDRELADDEFRGLDDETQQAIRSSFADTQLDFSLKDTAAKAIDYLTPKESAAVVGYEPGTPPDTSGDIVAPPIVGAAAATEEPAPAPQPAMPTIGLTDTGIVPEDVTATRPFVFDPTSGRQLSPGEQDRAALSGLFGSGEEYKNPEMEDYELGKRMVNRINELTANAVQAVYGFLGGVKTPAEYLGITTKAQEDLNAKRKAWFDEAADKLNDFIYEKNKLAVKPTHTWKETKKAFKAGGIFNVDSWQELLSYGGSELVVSAPDMAEMVSALPLYFASRLQESAEKRAKNDGRTEPTARDYLAVAPTVAGSIMLDLRGLRATTVDVVERVGKDALDGSLKSAFATIGKEMGKGGLVEAKTEAVQNPLEMYGEEIGTRKGLSPLGEYADVTLAGFAAGWVGGQGMSGVTSTGTELFNSYTKAKQEAQREQFIAEAYKRQSQSNLILVTDDAARQAFEANLDGKIRAVQAQFENLVINNPGMELPVEAADDVVVQEAVVEQAKADGLDVGDRDGLNAIDKGFRDLQEEIGGEPMQPKGLELEAPAEPVPTPIIEKPVIGQPEPEAKGTAAGETVPAMGAAATAPESFTEDDAARLAELEQIPDDDLNIDDRFELEDLREKRDAGGAAEPAPAPEEAPVVPGQTYEARHNARMAEAASANSAEDLDAIMDEAAKDEERDFDSYSQLKSAVDKRKRTIEAAQREAAVTQKYENGDWVAETSSSSERQATAKAEQLAKEDQENEYRVYPGQGDFGEIYVVEKRKKPAATETAPVPEAAPVEEPGAQAAIEVGEKEKKQGPENAETYWLNATEADRIAMAEASGYEPADAKRAASLSWKIMDDAVRDVLERGYASQVIPKAEASAEPAPETITVKIRGQNGEGEAVFDTGEWEKMGPAAKVLAIHERLRDVTGGQPFDIVTREKSEAPAVKTPTETEARFDELNTKWEPTLEEETEHAALADELKDQLEGEERETETATAEEAAPAAAGDIETVPAAPGAGAQQRGGEGTGDQRIPGRGADARLIFDTEKVYGIGKTISDYPNKEVGKRIQKDVARYVGQLAKATGYEFDVNAKGKKLPWNGVSANLPAAGGDMAFRLFKPGSDVGVYVSLSYQPDMDQYGGYDSYKLRGIIDNRQMWRTTIRGKSSQSDGSNQWISNDMLTDASFIDAIMKAVDAEERRADEDRGKTRTDQTDKTEPGTGSAATPTPGRDAGKGESDGRGTTDGRNGAGKGDTGSTVEGVRPQRDTGVKEKGAEDDTDERGRAGTAQPVPADGGRGAGETVEPGAGRGEGGVDAGRSEVPDTSAETKRPAGEVSDERDRGERPHRTGDGGVKNQFALEQNDAVTRGEVARFNDNYAALEILKAEKPFHTKEELLTLSRYTGWGGVQNLFPRPDGSFDSNSWRDRNTAFRELVTKEEYEAAEKSILDAFYTPPKIIGAMWKISQRLGFDGGHVLEPSAGTGRFIGMVPPGISRVSFDGIELDPVTAKIAAILYPKSNIRNIGFEKTNYPESFEMVIGNPPYGDFTIYDPNEKELSRLNIHNYFMAKSLKALKPGGVLNFVITASFMENLNVTTVRAIDGQAKLVGAIRLPSNIFKASGTEVTTDIVIFQKLQPGEKGNAAEWFGRVKQPSGINLNKYFDAHPEMLLGKWEKGFRGNRAVAETDNIDAQLNAAIGLLPEKIVPSFQGELREQLIAAADTSVTPSVMYEKNGKYFVNIKAGEWYDVIEMKGELPKSYIPLRDALKRVIDMQNSAAATESDLTGARRALNVQYDAFVKKHGPLNKAQNRNLIVNDNYGYTVLALEIDGKKAPIFTTRTSSPVRNVKTKDAKEALTITVNTRGRVDMETMTDITGKSEAELVTELRGEIFFDDKENRYVTKEVYLSGDVKSKLATATDQLAIDALLKVIPEDKKAQDIPVQMGVSWIGPEHIRLFAQEVMGFRNIAVTFNKELAKWDVKGSSFSNPFEIPQYNAADTLEYALNQKRMTIKETINKKSYVNEEATAYANQKLEELKDRFASWIFADAKRADVLVARYNELYNRHVIVDAEAAMKDYDVPNTSESFKARMHQKRAVYRAVYGNSPLLLNHPVGSGKTFTSQMVTMEWKRLGIANKPVIATLKSVVPQYAREFKIAYPNANILVPTEADFSARNRKRLLSTIATGNYDAIIITHDNLKALQNPTETVREIYEERLDELKASMSGAEGRTRSQLQKRIEKLRGKYEEITNVAKDEDVLSFDQLGIDGLIVDESHRFKKIGFSSSMDVKGIDTEESQMAVDLLIKTRHILKSSNNVVLMTGTPITNTLPELFSIQRVLQPKLLKQQGIYEFDSWAKQYTVTETDIETTGVGKLKEITRVKNYTNLDALYASVGQIMDTVTNEEIIANDPTFVLPPLRNGEPTQVILEPSELQEQYAAELDDRLQVVNQKDNPDNYLNIFGDAERMSLDIRFVIPDAPDNPNSKANQSVERAMELYRKYDEVKGVQMIFSDIGIPNKEGRFDLYNDIKKKLVARGVPAKEIALISDYDTAVQKSALSKKARAGEIRFVIGSTTKLGTGVNMQDLLVAEHHLDIPYTPAELEQRYGRILRQGNKLIDQVDGFEVEIFLYATAKTLDGSKWQILKNKMQFIHDFQSGQISESSELDIDEGSQKEQAERMIALTSGNPLLLDRIKAEKKLKKLRALKRGYDYARAGNLRDLEYEKSVLEQSDTIIENIDADREQTENHRIMIGSKQYEKAGELGQAVIDELLKFKESRGLAAKTIGSVGDIDVKIEYNRQNDNAVVSYVGKTKDSTEFKLLTQSPSGLGVRMQNMADPELFVKRAKNQARMKADAEERIPALEKALEERFEKGDELEATETELERINAEMKAEAKNQPKETAEPEEKAELMMAASAEAKAKTTPKARAQQRETEHYARANGYDEAGANYVPTYKISGLPSRPEEGKIAIGDRTIALPTLEAPINADTIRAYLSDIVGNRLYETKIRNNSALGKYSRDDSAIRLKSYSDVEIMAHELAHYLDYFHNNPKRTATGSWFRSQIMKHRDEIEALSYTTKPKEVVAEGFAEFVRLWLTNYNTVKALAPGMVKAFEIRMKQDKELHNKMQLLQEGMHQFYYQGESAMLRGRRGGELNKTAKKIRRSQQEIGKELRQQAIDKLHSIKRIEAKVRGDVAADAIDSPYKLLQLVNGHSAVLYSAMNIGVPTVTAEGDLTYSGKSLNEIFAPATNVGEDRVRLLEDYLVARRAEELTEQGRENLITIEEINTGLELASVYREFETIFEEYQAFNDAMLDFYVDMNLITSTQRETFREFNRNYVPFHRIVESVQNGEVPPSSIGKRLTGGTHSLGNIMENIIDGLDTNIREAMIARGKSVFYDMLEKSGMGGVYATKVGRESRKVQSDVEQQAKKIAQMMVQLGISVSKDGMILSGDMTSGEVYDVREIEENLIANPAALEFWTHGHKPTSTAGYIDSAIIDDKMVYFEVNDPGIVDSITSFRSAHYNEFVRGLMTTKNIMTWNITNNPLFYLTNFMRDTVSGAVLSKNKFLPVISSMTGIYHFVTKSKSYKEFMAAGGGYGTRRTALGKEIDAMTLLKVNRGFEVVGRVASAMEYGADIFEYGTRLGDFFLAQESGKSNMQAAYEAREVSTDFAVKGSNMGLTGFMATVPFMKAAVNGLDKTARRVFTLNGEMKLSNAAKFRNQLGELQTHKIKLYATGGILTTLSLGLWLQNRDDERFKKLTRDQKMLYWNFFIGDRHIKIPKPYDIGFAFASLPELIADGTYTKHGKEAAEDFLWGLKTMFSIGDVSGMFQPVLEQMTNTNWMGSPIVPYHMRNMDDLGDQYFSTTPLMYRKLGELTGASPILTQHYVDGYLGLTAKMIEEITENMLWNTKEWGARPFAKDPLEFLTYRFSGRKVEPRTKYSEKYYELMERASAVQASYSAKRKAAVIDKGEDVKEYMSSKEKQAYVAVDKMMRQYQKLLTNIKLAVEAITYDRKLTKAQKEQKINDAYTARTELFKTVTENLEEELKKLEGK